MARIRSFSKLRPFVMGVIDDPQAGRMGRVLGHPRRDLLAFCAEGTKATDQASSNGFGHDFTNFITGQGGGAAARLACCGIP
jgi:hypothetical protein